jgi:hypothetical protein
VYLGVLCGEILHKNFTTEDTDLHRSEFFRASLSGPQKPKGLQKEYEE